MTHPRAVFLTAILFLGCRGPGEAPEPRSSSRTSSTDGFPEVLSLECSLAADNALRGTCAVTLARAGHVRVHVGAAEEDGRVFQSVVAADRHEIPIYGLRSSTVYDIEAGAQQTTLQTDALPATLASATITVTGEAHGFDAVLQPLSCPDVWYFVMIDGIGEIVWYEPVDIYDNRGWDWSEAHRTLLVSNSDVYVELDLAGEERLRLTRGEHFAHELHHDLARWGRFTYLLQERPNRPHRNVDYVEVFDGTTSVGAFRLEDHFDVTVGGAGTDWSHANSIDATPDGEMVLSLHHLDMVLGFDADPDSPTFLDLTWQLNGSDRGVADPPPDFVPADAAAGFRAQHCASRADDSLLLLDNHGQDTSRGLRLALDHETGLAHLVREWSLGETCPIQGGAFALDDGGVMLTCPSTAEVQAFGDDDAVPYWTMQARCGGPTLDKSEVTKGVPLRIR